MAGDSEAQHARSGRSAVRADDAGFGLVEALVALIVLTVGLLGIASIALAVAGQRPAAAVRSDQAFAAQEVIERARNEDFSALSIGTETVTIRGRSHEVERTVTRSGDVKRLELVIEGRPRTSPDTFWTRIDRSGAYPTCATFPDRP